MVVTRRTPVVPPPQLTRNHSQGAQRPPQRAFVVKDTAGGSKNSTSSVAAGSLAGSSDDNKDHHDSLVNHSGKRSRKSKRHGRNKHQKSNFQAFLDFLTRFLLLAFTIYAFSVCPQDAHLQSPICRGLTEYKRIVLDPYIIPPIQAILVHPSVAPYVERVAPYVHRAVEVTTPVLLRTQQEWNLRVVPQWEKRIVPEWKKRVVPQWNKHVVPQLDKYVAPRIQLVQSTLEPYLLRVRQEYGQRIAPRAQVAIYNLQRWQRLAQPYILSAVSKTKDGYYATKPYVLPLVKKAGRQLQKDVLFLRELRQQFVDPHVAKIREKVKELSRGRQILHEAAPDREPQPTDASFTIIQISGEETTVSSTESLTPAYHATSIPEKIDRLAHVSSSLSLDETEAESYSTSVKSTPTPVPEPEAFVPFGDPQTDMETLVTESVLAETVHESERPTFAASAFLEETPSITSSASATAATTLSSRPPPTVDEPTESPAFVTPSKVAVTAASATVPPSDSRADDEIDFDAFYAELGLEEPLGNPVVSEEYNPGPPSPPGETEEEKAERLRLKAEEAARKRADIEARQSRWETELRAQMERGTSQLQSRLGNLRTAAAAELASSVQVRTSIEDLVSEAEKYLKGAEIYLKNLKGENRRSDEKLPLWDRVVERVSDKFGERLLATEGVVHAWRRIMLDKELQEVATVSAEVREVAEKGQLDLGLDYAWLEDVTYNDWQRYHALIGSSEQYAQEAASIQNGTHPNVVVTNPIAPILQDLESEVQDVVIGFETRLRRIKRDGERAFNHGGGVAQKEEEKGSSVESEAEVEPDVSILPVPDEGAREEEQGFVPPVVIGRSQEEVLAALDKVGPGSGAEQLVSGSHVDPEEAVSRLAREVEGGAKVSHTEL